MFGFLKGRKAEDAPIVAPQLPIDLTAPEFVADPYPTYAWLRENQPVAELEGGGYVLTRHADIMDAFTNPALGNAPSRFSTLSARNAQKYVAADLASHIPPFLDGVEHKQMRQMASRSFFNTFKAMPGELDELAQSYVAGLSSGDDLITGASQPFSLSAMIAFCGLQVTPDAMKPLTQAFFHLFAPLKDPAVFNEVNSALEEFRNVIAASLANGPKSGSLLAEMRAFQGANDGISDAQIIDNCLLIFADGVENIEAGAASLMLVFEQNNLWDSLENGALDLTQAIREGLRLQTPAQLVPRVAREACEISGVAIKKDMPVFLALASGNRDVEVFAGPDRFDATRDFAKVVTFGLGRHRCIGEPLAMMQLGALMQAIVSSKLRPVEETTPYQCRVGHRWPESLIVKKY